MPVAGGLPLSTRSCLVGRLRRLSIECLPARVVSLFSRVVGHDVGGFGSERQDGPWAPWSGNTHKVQIRSREPLGCFGFTTAARSSTNPLSCLLRPRAPARPLSGSSLFRDVAFALLRATLTPQEWMIGELFSGFLLCPLPHGLEPYSVYFKQGVAQLCQRSARLLDAT